VVVAAGLTACVPPLDCRVYVVPSVPVTVTAVALVATTVKVDELPGLMETGLATMLTVAAELAVTVTVALAEVFPPMPAAAAV
jgi:hypothetical protein